ncbi:MAG: tRNA pseudouridine(55) synthase TruB [Candidatus Omnitrophica bacterium]|nr:tRNA pseudouridine(55) synthase TruB [Candidatus Omnitrophota bacterium]
MNGILLFDKPILWTSHDAVDFLRRRLGQSKIGHAGTLDPLATGLLVMLLGRATKLAQGLGGLDKEYQGSLTLGVTTDTQDMEGRALSGLFLTVGPIFPEDAVRRVFNEMRGVQAQRPPAYSAVKRGGKKLYELARQGLQASVEPREIIVHALELVRFRSPEIDFTLHCSKGTYVRALCDAIGQKLGCGATLSSLVRTRVGSFDRSRALSEADIRRLALPAIKEKLIHEDLLRPA